MIVAVVLYFLAGGVLLLRGWLIRAGLAMVAASLIPLTWQVTFTDSDAPGFGFLLMLMLPPALGLTLAGLVWWSFRKLTHSA